MRAQLRRQAAAHSDHLADVLSVQVMLFLSIKMSQSLGKQDMPFPLIYICLFTLQSAELTRKNDHILDEKLSAAKSEYLTSLSALSGTVTGLTEALTSRATADKASLRAQVRIFLCLRDSVKVFLCVGLVAGLHWVGGQFGEGQCEGGYLGRQASAPCCGPQDH